MKRLFPILLILLSVSPLVQAQDFEGVITFGISYPDLTPEMKAMEASLPKEMSYHIKGNKTKMEQPVMGGSVIVLFDGNTGTTETYTDVMGQKVKTVATKEDLDKTLSEQSEMKVQILEEEKEVAGYSCKKAIITQEGQPELTIYYSEEINVESITSLSPQFKDLKGFPLEYSVAANGMSMQMIAKKVESQSIDDAVFQAPEGDYREMPAFGN